MRYNFTTVKGVKIIPAERRQIKKFCFNTTLNSSCWLHAIIPLIKCHQVEANPHGKLGSNGPADMAAKLAAA